jgi:MFS family permease
MTQQTSNGISTLSVAPVSQMRAVAVIFMASLLLFTNNGFILVGLTAFDPILLTKLDVNVGVLKLRDTVTFITVGAMGPFIGYALDRFGVRPLTMIGMVLMAVGMLGYAFATEIGEIYVIHFLFGLCLICSGMFACVMMTAAVTTKNRGLGLGIVTAGSSLGQAISPWINNTLNAGVGWRHTLEANAALPLLLIPLILLIVPKLKFHADGGGSDAASGSTYLEAIKTRSFWFLAVIAMIAFFSGLGLVSNMVLYIEKDLQLGSGMASRAIFGMFLAGLVAQVSAGWLADRIGAKTVLTLCLVMMAAGMAMFATALPVLLWPAIAIGGFGWGGIICVVQLFTSNLFFGAALGRILGTIAVVESLGAGLGPTVVGHIYDISGHYAAPFFGSAGAVAFAAILAWNIKSPERLLSRRAQQRRRQIA